MPGSRGRRETSVRRAWQIWLTAVMFLTRIPVPSRPDFDDGDLARCTPYFPLVGLLVGGIAAAVYALTTLVLPATIAAVLAVATAVTVTGAFHEDGLADTFDGFGGWSVDDKLAIMTDSRMGTYGTVALLLVIALKLAALTTLGALGVGTVAGTLVVGHVLARWSSLPLIRWMDYVQHSSAKSRPFAASVTSPRLLAGSALAAGITVVALPGHALAALIAAVLATALGGLWLHRQLGGMTGDALGAVNSLTEAAVYLAVCVSAGLGTTSPA